MIEKTNLKIAYAHLTSRIKQSIIAVLSVTFGISMYVFMNGFMKGVNDAQTDLAFSTLAHIKIYNDLPVDNSNLLKKNINNNTIVHISNPKVIQYTEGIINAEQTIDAIKKIPEISGIAPQLNINVFFRNGSTKVNGLLSGIDTQNEDLLFGTAKYVIQGSWTMLNTQTDGMLIGKGLAQKLSLSLKDNISVTTADGIAKNFKIVGIVETTLAGVDNQKAYIRINAARQLLSKNASYVSDIQINVKDFNKAHLVAQKMKEYTQYKVEPWMEANGQLQAANGLREIIAVAVSLTILLVAGFGIYNIMNMTVNEKIREIAILKAMGFDGNDVVQIFLSQSIVIGILGGWVGMALGYTISLLVGKIPFQIASLDTLPVASDAKDYLLAFVFGLMTTFVAGYLPAKKASKIDPVEIIRG
ncbi:ABC transporter permease [Arcicella rigui]|uniref:FtsX-like permease family protein n=1 Tax=Arcicella rigui TaxID=797020 RepID=A0ABU5Q8R7_9BACT|nr:FtsX-like permease family protein [Arcicella rigui]MEA5139240.1 FtsX-like permease family protein [Arcicella rigui]